MLDNTTKRLIDSARDILVGKVPDPKGQIEHITIALIYKFMDDMDIETVEKYGGKAKYFTGEYAKYSWRKLFDPKLGGHDMLALYREAVEKMYLNPSIPDLFKSIFKNAYLSFNSPDTLRMFLKNINEFNYDHSENLGDAYEYLLSVLGTQGDAGQFRTPRHIIEFIVSCVDPQKHESILDPACGTAGFILSSYKHILRNNCDKLDGDKLTPTEKKHIAENLVGFDIDPNMVRFSLVNMFLHKFQTPHIYEYDTLSSEDRWNEYYDVIVANPPFMSPKGGIKPHKRFSIQATKSEVLFTDYMAEHLAPNGRAGIIVPNGIIATTQTAYKSLRKMLVENYLVAVVSLPAGVFSPYSGVKTSVLLLDKKLSKVTDSILFIKVENDGYDLGAQRREIDKNDLPQALNIFKRYKDAILVNKEFIIDEYGIATLVKKEKLLENKDVNLSADRYLKNVNTLNSEYTQVNFSELIDFVRGVTYSKEDEVSENGIKILRANNISLNNVLDLSDIRLINPSAKVKEQQKLYKNDILMCTASGSSEHIGKVAFIENDMDCYFGGFMGVIRTKDNVLAKYIFEILKTPNFRNHLTQQISQTNIRNFKFEFFESFSIPLPPIEIQQQIVAEIECYQKIIDGARMVVENYKPSIKINPAWVMVELGEVVIEKYGVKAGPFGSSLKKSEYVSKSEYKIYGLEQVIGGNATIGNYFISEEKFQELKSCEVKPNDVLISLVGTIGRSLVVPKNSPKGIINPRLLRIRVGDKLNPVFLSYVLKQDYVKTFLKNESGGGTMDVLNGEILKRLLIPLPNLEEQIAIISQIEEEQKIVEANKRLIALFERKIKDKIAEVWGEKETKEYSLQEPILSKVAEK
jgi:type I restriction enzyme M protein